ncbi:MAG: hypothetical protein AAGF97_09115 [Planctomycetota bacterium]
MQSQLEIPSQAPPKVSSDSRRRLDYFLGDGVTLRTSEGRIVEARTVGRRIGGLSVLTSPATLLATGTELRLVSHEGDRLVRVVRRRPWGASQRLELVWQDRAPAQ